MAYDVDHRPGAWVRAQASRRAWIFWILFAAGAVITAFILALAFGHRIGAGGTLAMILALLAVRPYAERYIDDGGRWFRGAQAEESVGDTLNELRREGWVLMHDVEQDFEGNIDHIAWGPENGVFLIETKARRYEEHQLTKAKRQAAKLHDELGVWVTPVICLYDRRGKAFTPKGGVAVVPRQHLLEWLRRQRNKTVPFERLAHYADRVS